MPFRNYLLQYVVPTLNEGLLEVANFLPDDPVDFLVKDKKFIVQKKLLLTF